MTACVPTPDGNFRTGQYSTNTSAFLNVGSYETIVHRRRHCLNCETKHPRLHAAHSRTRPKRTVCHPPGETTPENLHTIEETILRTIYQHYGPSPIIEVVLKEIDNALLNYEMPRKCPTRVAQSAITKDAITRNCKNFIYLYPTLPHILIIFVRYCCSCCINTSYGFAFGLSGVVYGLTGSFVDAAIQVLPLRV